MAYRIQGLDPAPYRSFWSADDATLAASGVVRQVAKSCPGYPDRITLADAPPGHTVLLMNHVSLTTPSPYHASHAIFVLEGAEDRFDAVDELPPVFFHRPQSIRGFDANGMMRAADLAEGDDIAFVIDRFFEDPDIAEIHAHNAKPGCFNARITRA